jgi:radical SAM superfamily enzyme YgiQ (UPF0313 family)
MPLLFGRGCPNECSFCNDHRFLHGYRRRSAERLLEEISFLKARYLAHDFVFNDLILNADLSGLREFCSAAVSRGVRMAFTGQASINPRMTKEDFALLARTGCASLVFGVESFSDKVLSAMKKRFIARDALKTLRMCKDAGIKPLINLIVGFPGETEEDFNTTLEAVRSNADLIHAVSSASMCMVTARSPLEQTPEKFGICLPEKNHWRLWKTRDGSNNYEVRFARLQKLLQLLDELQVKRQTANRYIEAVQKAAG